MQERPFNLPFSMAKMGNETRMILNLLRSEAGQLAALQLSGSLLQLMEIQRYVRLHVEWTPEQVSRQRERVARHQARLQWQHEVFAQLKKERSQATAGNQRDE